jgi:diaminohydroxyphosphoribosylaminopyrimidine deaminase/5-amino-6-(5-phosphoribosylamino)uracil reductase
LGTTPALRDLARYVPFDHDELEMSVASQRADERDAAFMRRALTLAKKGWGQTAPNPMVGAVVVKEGVLVGEGYHAQYGEAHAEIEALRAAGERARGATVYVSLEPCNHFGKTPPCVDALIAAGVSRVVAATRDPSPTAGGGAERLRAAGIDVAFDVEAKPARELNASFFHSFASDRPWVTLKLALSIDGAIADASRVPAWLTGKKSRREVHRLRAGSDAIAVGLGTVRADNPELTVRDVPPPRVAPARVVFTRRGQLPLTSALARTATEVPTIVVAESVDLAYARRLMPLGVEVLAATSIEEGMRALRQRGFRSLLVEGGAGITGALLGANLVDRLIIFQAPVLLGAGSLPGFENAPSMAASGARRFPIVHRAELDDDLMTVYALHSL